MSYKKYNNGIYFYGDGSNIAGFEQFMIKNTGCFSNIIVDENFEKNGCKKLIESPALLKSVSN